MMFKRTLSLGFFIVLAAVIILGTFAADFETFKRQHYDNPKSKVGRNYCNVMMQRRGMTKRSCKPVNTFIHGTIEEITAVCRNQGTTFGQRLRKSQTQFQLTTCTKQGSSRHPTCDYNESTSSRSIVIACDNGLPVHYEKDI